MKVMEKQRYLEKNLSQFHFIHQKSHMDWPGMKSKPPRPDCSVKHAGVVIVLIPLVVNMVAALELWLPGHEVVYQYKTSLVASTVSPEHVVSQWNMSGKLVVQGGEDLATVQLQDLNVSIYTGPRSHDTPIVETPLPEQASQLSQPFVIHYFEGQVVGLSVKAGEEEWSINMKRGLVSLLQLDLLHLQSSAFISTENSQYGHCSVQYSVQSHSNGTVAVQKFVDLPSCVNFPVQKFSNVRKMFCSSEVPTETVSSGSMRAYILEPSAPGGHLLIHSIQADGVTHLQHPNLYFLQSRMSLYILWQHKVEAPLPMKGGGERVELVHQMPGADVSQGRSPPSQQDLLTMVTEILGELADSLEWWHLETNLDKVHEEHVVHALHFLALLELDSLHKLFLELEVGTSYQRETLRNLFLELLPLVGSHDSMLLVRDLVIRGTVRNDTAIRLLSSLPFNVHQPSEQLLTDLEVLLLIPEDTLEHPAALLSFATLVHQVCSSGCLAETVDKYVGRYLDLFTGSKDYAHQMLYLAALTNFELRQVVQLLMPLIRGDNGRYPHHTRAVAMWATMGCSALQPEQVYHLYWPLLTNSSEDLEVRVVALTMLVLGQPSGTHLYNLMLFMQQERNAHLRHFWHTTLHSLAHSQHPCHIHMREVAKKLVQLVVKPKLRYWTGGNYILDYADPDNGFSSQANLIIVSNSRTGLPTVFNLEIGSHTMGYSYNQFSIFIRLEGLGAVIKQQLMQDRSFNVTQLVTMLQQLKIPTKPSEHVHVELLVRVQNKVVLVHHANESTLNTLFRVLNSAQLLANDGIHLNAQKIFVPFLIKEMRVTDLGTNVLLQVLAGGLVSVRANFSTSPVLSSGLELRSSLSNQMSLSLYNPVLNVWHGVQRSLNMQLNTAFNLQVSFNATQEGVSFTIQHTPVFQAKEMGLVMHMRTLVFVKGVAAATKLKSHCATCPVHLSVTRNVPYSLLQNLLRLEMSGLRLELALLDCEHSFSEGDLLELIYHASPARIPLLKLLHLFNYLMLLPDIGRCGLLARVLPAGTQPIKVEAIFQGQRAEQLEPLPAGEYRARLCIVQSLVSNASSSWDLCIMYVHLPAVSNHSITMELTTHGGHKMCLNLTTSFLDLLDSAGSLINPRPHSATAVLSVAWGPPTNGEQCPLEKSLEVALEGRVTTEQWNLVSSATACRWNIRDTQQWDRHHLPLTRACLEVACELTTLRHYNISITSINLPTWMDALQNFLPSKVESMLSRNMSVQLLVPPEGRPVLTVNSYKMMLGSAVGTQLQPWLINTQFPPLLRLFTYLGITGSCMLTEHSVWTLDEHTVTTHVPTCYTVAMADCSSHPQFAVFLKKVDSTTSPLAVRVYKHDNYVEVLPTADQLSISVNGQIMRSPQEGYQYSSSLFKVWQHPDGLVRIHLADGDVWLEYYGDFITVSVLGLYHGGLCGLCGDHDGDPSNDAGQAFTLPCPGRQ